MEILFIIGRILFGGMFLFSGIEHFTTLDAKIQYTASKGIPSPRLATILTGILLIAGGAGVVFGVYPTLALWLIIIFLVPTSFLMHNFWAVPEEQKANQKIAFMKNMALTGAALALLSVPLPWTLSLL